MRGGRAYSATLAKDLVRVEVGSVMYAIEVARIREIVNPLPVVELPREHDFVLGVADYREEVVPVIDLRSLFGSSQRGRSRRTKWIILAAGGRLVGIVVDAVIDVFSSGAEVPREVPILDERHHKCGIGSAYRHDGRLVFLLDADRLAEPATQLPDEMLAFPTPGAP